MSKLKNILSRWTLVLVAKYSGMSKEEMDSGLFVMSVKELENFGIEFESRPIHPIVEKKGK